jgi:hypothetical protein
MLIEHKSQRLTYDHINKNILNRHFLSLWPPKTLLFFFVHAIPPSQYTAL